MTVNSLSGGKTSSFIAVHYPADLEIFACVCIDNHNVGRDIDPGIKKRVNEKLNKFCPQYGDFKATAEDPKTLKVILDLEQKIGREIVWVRDISFEKMIEQKQALPNKRMRFCTTTLKIRPIFWHLWLYYYCELPVQMRIGYRYDEAERGDDLNNDFTYSIRCEKRWGEIKGNHWVNRYIEHVDWREPEMPLIEDRVSHWTIHKYWSKENIDFPLDSNCQFCYHKPQQQLRQNFETNPPVMFYAAIMEDMAYATFSDKRSLLNTRKLGLQTDFFGGAGMYCNSGGCTD